MIHVIATVELAEGKTRNYLAELNKVIPAVRAEKGCIEYGPAVDIPSDLPVQGPIRDHTVVIIEKWSDMEALKAHLTAPHMNAYRDAVKDMVRTVTVQILKPV